MDDKDTLLLNIGQQYKIRFISSRQFNSYSPAQRRLTIQRTLNYLRALHNLPNTSFKQADGSDVEQLTLEQYIQTVEAQPKPSSHIDSLMPIEAIVHWVISLQAESKLLTAENKKKLNELTSEIVHGTFNNLPLSEKAKLLKAEIKNISSKISAIDSTLNEHQQQWPSDATAEAVQQALHKDSEELRKLGLNDLADKAYRVDEQASLYSQLSRPSTSTFDPSFDKANYATAVKKLWLKKMIDQPPASLLQSMKKIASALKRFTQDPLDIASDPPESNWVDTFTEGLKKSIQPDLTNNWLQHNSQLKAFYQEANTTLSFKKLLAILDRDIQTGYDCLLISYLNEKIYSQKLLMVEQLRKTSPAYRRNFDISHHRLTWIRVTEKNLEHFRQETHPFLKEASAPIPLQKELTAPEHLPSNYKINEIAHRWLGFLCSFNNASNRLDIQTIKEAFLGMVLYLSYQYDYSVTNILWAAYQREVLHPKKFSARHLELGLDILPKGTTVTSHAKFANNSTHWLSWYKGTEVGQITKIAIKAAEQEATAILENKKRKIEDADNPSTTNKKVKLETTSAELEKEYETLKGINAKRKTLEFNNGYAKHEQIDLPGLDNNSSASAMKRFAIKNQDTGEFKYGSKLMGALEGKIASREQAEQKLARTIQATYKNKITGLFTESGANNVLHFSPLAYQGQTGKPGGLCYGMVYAVAGALASNDKNNVNNLALHAQDADQYPLIPKSEIFKQALTSLHMFANARQPQSTSTGTTPNLKRGTIYELIAHINAQLAHSVEPGAYILSTPTHAMLLMFAPGDATNGHQRQFYFFDSNTALVRFSTTAQLSDGLGKYFDKDRLTTYGAITANDDLDITQAKFELSQLDLDVIKNLEIGVNDFSFVKIEDLWKQNSINEHFKPRYTKILKDRTTRLTQNVYLDQLYKKFDAERMSKGLLDATKVLLHQENKSHEYVLLLPTVEEVPDQGYRLTLLNPKTQETHTAYTQDETFIEVKQYINKKLNQLDPVRTNATLEIPTIDGLNAGFAVQQILSWFMQKSRESSVDQNLASSLNIALQAHAYASMVQIAHATVLDVTHFVQIVSALQTGFFDATSSLGHTINTNFGLLLNGLFIGLDFYELVHAQNNSQKPVFSAQLICDSTSFISSTGALILGWGGAATASAFLGYLAVPLSGISYGAVSLAQVYSEIVNDVDQVCRLFEMIDTAYRQGVLDYDAAKKIITSYTGGVVERLDFKNKQIKLGEQFVYAIDTQEGGHRYAYLYPDQDKSHAIGIRAGLGYADQINFSPAIQAALNTDPSQRARAFVLPATPQAYFYPYYQWLLGIRSTQNAGAEVLRRLESSTENQRFHFMFEDFHFPYEHELRSITPKYLKTDIEIILDKDSPSLYVPSLFDENGLPTAAFDCLNYRIHGNGQEVILTLSEGVEIDLIDEPATTTWVLDTRLLKNNSLKIGNGQLTFSSGVATSKKDTQETAPFSGVTLRFNPKLLSKIKWIMANGEVQTLDPSNPLQSKVLSEDASQWASHNPQEIKAHLDTLNQQHQLANSFIPIDNYQDATKQFAGRAFYIAQPQKSNDTGSRIIYPNWQGVTQVISDLLTQALTKPVIVFEKITKIYRLKSTRGHYPTFNETADNKITYHAKAAPELAKLMQQALSVFQYSGRYAQTIRHLIEQLNSKTNEINQLLNVPDTGIDTKHYKLASKTTDTLNENEIRRKWGSTSVLQIQLDSQSKGANTGRKLSDIQTETKVIQQKIKQRLADVQRFDLLLQQQKSLLDQLKLAQTTWNSFTSQLSNEIELAGVVENKAFFYHPEHQWLWQVDTTTDQILMQFKLHPNLNTAGRIRAYQEGNQIYLTYTHHLANRYTGQLIYQLKNDQLVLVSITYDAQDDTDWPIWDKADINQIGYDTLLKPFQDLDKTETLHQLISQNKFLSQASYAPLITLTTHRTTSTGQTVRKRYWLNHLNEQQPGQVIQATVPNTEQSNDVLLLALLSENGQRVDKVTANTICFFYDYKNKWLYRQIGLGQSSATESAQKLPITNIKDVLPLDNGLFVLTTDNLLKQVDVNGKTQLAAIQASWLTAHSNDWKQQLATLALEHNGPLAIIGVQEKNRPIPIAVWYYQGHVVTVSQSIHADSVFLGLGQDAQGKYVRIFDQVSQTLYQQRLSDQAAPFIFSADTNIISVNAPLATTELFPDQRFQSATVLPDGVRLITTAGEILMLNQKSELHLIGVTQTWQEAHSTQGKNLLDELKTLSTKWLNKRSEIIVLKKNTDTSPVWYHPTSHQLFDSAQYGFSAQDKLRYIGFGSATKTRPATIWIYSPATKGLYKIIAPYTSHAAPVIFVENAERIGNVLSLMGNDQDNEFSFAPKLDGVQVLRLTGRGGQDRYDLNAEIRKHYELVVINNFDDAAIPAQDNAIFYLEDSTNILLRLNDNKLIASDAGSHTDIVIENAENKAAQHLTITFKRKNTSDSTVTSVHSELDQIIDNMAKLFENKTPTNQIDLTQTNLNTLFNYGVTTSHS